MNKIKMFITLLFFSFLFACNNNTDEETELAEYNIDFEFTFDAPQKYYYYDFETRIFLSPTRTWYINETITNWQTGDPSEGNIVKYTANKLKEEYRYIIILYVREADDREIKPKERFYISDTLTLKKGDKPINVKYPDDISTLLKPYTPPPTP